MLITQILKCFKRVNEAIDILIRKQFVIAKANTAAVYNEVILNLGKLEHTYEYIGRMPKKDINTSILMVLERYKDRK